jgi:hypothetical protein
MASSIPHVPPRFRTSLISQLCKHLSSLPKLLKEKMDNNKKPIA